jgi:hypothetical protein
MLWPEFFLARFGLVGLVWFGLVWFSWVWLVWFGQFGRFGLVDLVWSVWFGQFGLVWSVWSVWFGLFAAFILGGLVAIFIKKSKVLCVKRMVENRCFCIIIMLYNCNVKGTVSKNF